MVVCRARRRAPDDEGQVVKNSTKKTVLRWVLTPGMRAVRPLRVVEGGRPETWPFAKASVGNWLGARRWQGGDDLPGADTGARRPES